MMFASNSSALDVLRMSTTTSTENSGLLAVLNPVFESQYNVKLEVIAVGTGKALQWGRKVMLMSCLFMPQWQN